MKDTGKAFVAGAALMFTALVFLASTAGAMPALRFVPVEHLWTWDASRAAIAMDWFFRAGVSLAAGALAFALAAMFVARVEWARRPAVGRFAIGLGCATTLWAAGYMVLSLVTTPG